MQQIEDNGSGYSHCWLTNSDIESNDTPSPNVIKPINVYSEKIGDSLPSLCTDTTHSASHNEDKMHSAKSKPLAAAMDIMSALYPTQGNAFVSRRVRNAARSYWSEAKEDRQAQQPFCFRVHGKTCQPPNVQRNILLESTSKTIAVNKNNNSKNIVSTDTVLSSYSDTSNDEHCNKKQQAKTAKYKINVTKPIRNVSEKRASISLSLLDHRHRTPGDTCKSDISGYQAKQLNLPEIDTRCSYTTATDTESHTYGALDSLPHTFSADVMMQNKSMPGAHWSTRDYTISDKYYTEYGATLMNPDMCVNYRPSVYHDSIPEHLFAKGTQCGVTGQKDVEINKRKVETSRVLKDLVKVRDNLNAMSKALQMDKTSSQSAEDSEQRKDSQGPVSVTPQLKHQRLTQSYSRPYVVGVHTSQSLESNISVVNECQYANDSITCHVDKGAMDKQSRENSQSQPEDKTSIDDSPIKFKTVAFLKDKYNQDAQECPPAPPNSPRYRHISTNTNSPANKITYRLSPKSYVSDNVKRLMKKLLSSCPVSIAANRKPNSQFLASITQDMEAEQKLYREYSPFKDIPIGRRVLSSSETFRRNPTNHTIYNIANMRNQLFSAAQTNDDNLIPVTKPAKLHTKVPHHNHELCVLRKSTQKTLNKYRL